MHLSTSGVGAQGEAQGTRKRCALQLGVGQLAGPLTEAVTQANTLRQQHVFQHRQAHQQVERLEHKPDATVTQGRGGVIVELAYFAVAETEAASVGPVEPPDGPITATKFSDLLPGASSPTSVNSPCDMQHDLQAAKPPPRRARGARHGCINAGRARALR